MLVFGVQAKCRGVAVAWLVPIALLALAPAARADRAFAARFSPNANGAGG